MKTTEELEKKKSNTRVQTIIDNRNENTLLAALKKLLLLTKSLDVATGYFEIGSLLELDGIWQKLKNIKIILGDETTRRTRKELIESLQRQSDESIERAKEEFDDNLTGLEAIRDALDKKLIQTKIYPKAKFHAKAYLMEAIENSPVNFGIVGSSNFTKPGLTQNLELNLFTTEQNQLNALNDWFSEIWKDGENVAPEIIEVIKPHLKLYSPFEVYVKALYEYFKGREQTPTGWEEAHSKIYPMLSKYQKDGFHRALEIANKWNGALICDGVGLGKTFIGLMLLEYFIDHPQEKKRVCLIVPNSARESVWEKTINENLKPHMRKVYQQTFVIYNHSNFRTETGISESDFEELKSLTDVIIVDEAHHFRNTDPNQSKKLFELADGKKIFLLTATPINNSLYDLRNLINYFARRKPTYFKEIAINDFHKYFNEMETKIEESLKNESAESFEHQSEDIMREDALLGELLIQRSRKYVRESEGLEENRPCFPERQRPKVINYSLNKVYEGLFDDIKNAFHKDKPLLTLAIYDTERMKKENIDERVMRNEGQVIGLIRTLLLKRLESSWKAFEASLEDLLYKMAYFVKTYRLQQFEEWKTRYSYQWDQISRHRTERFETTDIDEEENDNPDVKQIDETLYEMDSIVSLVFDDMNQIISILTNIYSKLNPQNDEKLNKLVSRIKSDPTLKGNKMVLFTEFRDTARYLYYELTKTHRLTHVEQIDGSTGKDKLRVIKRFAPYYNCKQDELSDYLENPIRILLSTDVLAEGLNLQDAKIIINYDLHWNPVRLMQRIGRVDRRVDLKKPIHHDKIYVYNFLPPDDLEDLLNLFKRVSGKTLRINKTLGLEAPFLTPDDDDATLKLFNEIYEPQKSTNEILELELQRIEKEYPELYQKLENLPRRLFSGKEANYNNIKGLFCAYRFELPPDQLKEGKKGPLKWYFYKPDTNEIFEGIENIHKIIACEQDNPRKTKASKEDLKAYRLKIEDYIYRTYLRATQATISQKPSLVCWMEVC